MKLLCSFQEFPKYISLIQMKTGTLVPYLCLLLEQKCIKKVLQKLDESKNLTDICSQKFMDLREEVRSILTNSGHCDPADLYPHLEKGNLDQIVILNMILEWIYPNGRENHIVFGSSDNTVKKTKFYK